MNLGQDGAPDTGGTLKIYGEALRKEVFSQHNHKVITINDDHDDSSSTALASLS